MAGETTLTSIIDAFNDDFSNQRLDAVMEYFSDNAEFRELGGKVAVGKDRVRKSFQRLFDGAYGKVTFIPKNLIVDEEKRQASFVWCCQHELLSKDGLSLVNRILFSILKARHGSEFYWEGVDYFIFDDNYKIVSKQSYGKAGYPKFIRGKFKL